MRFFNAGVGRKIVMQKTKKGMKLRTKLTKLTIPLRYFEKLEVLTPENVAYLKEYLQRVTPKEGQKDEPGLEKKRMKITEILASKKKLDKDPNKSYYEKPKKEEKKPEIEVKTEIKEKGIIDKVKNIFKGDKK